MILNRNYLADGLSIYGDNACMLTEAMTTPFKNEVWRVGQLQFLPIAGGRVLDPFAALKTL
jgi:hypothetical protein